MILATSGMLNGGPIIEYFKRLGPDEKNTLVIVGYQAEGTLGRRIQKGWKEVPLSAEGKTQTVKMNLEVTTVDGFSGHSDRKQLMEYIRRIYPKPGRILTNHGEEGNCLDLAISLQEVQDSDHGSHEPGDCEAYLKCSWPFDVRLPLEGVSHGDKRSTWK